MRIVGGFALAVESVLAFAFAACSADRTPDGTGQLHAALTAPASMHDVAAIFYKVLWNKDDTCASTTAIATAIAPLETGAIATGGGLHHFGDHFFVLPPDEYRICATPVKANGTPSDECGTAEDVVIVLAGVTTEITLVSQCEGNPTGGNDTIVVLNDPPVIIDLTFAPSKFITACEAATITVAANDPNGDALGTTWSITARPAGSAATLVPTPMPSGFSATFMPDLIGDYTLRVMVTDALGGKTSLSFPIHVTGDCWKRAANVLHPREGYAAVAIGGTLYYAAGLANIGDSTINDAYNPVLNIWTPRAPVPGFTRSETAGVTDGTFLYMIGGRGSPVVGTETWRYDPGADSWMQLARMPTARATEYVSAYDAGKIYVVGGRTGSAPAVEVFLDVMEVYDIATNTWSSGPPLPEPRSDSVVLARPGFIYVFGGYANSGGSLVVSDSTFIFDIAAGVWKTGANMPEPRGNASGGVCGDQLHVIAGASSTLGGLSTNNFAYDPATNTWQTRAPSLVATGEAQGVSHAGKIFVASGGIRGSGPSNPINQFYVCP